MKYVIIGSSIAAKSAAETVIPRINSDDQIVIISNEEVPFYSRVLLPDYIAGKIDYNVLKLRDGYIVHDEHVTMVEDRVTELDTETKKVLCSNQKTVSYDKCFICSGASPKKASIPGTDSMGVFSLRTLDDAQKIIDYSGRAERCTVLGGGLVSLKAAWALQERGKKVTVAVSSPEILSRVADSYTAQMIRKSFVKNGVNIQCGITAGEIQNLKDGKVHGVAFEEGSSYPADMVIVGKGVRPSLGFISECGIETGTGIITNSRMQTSAAEVYAAGDVAQPPHFHHKRNELITLWPEAVFQARIAAENALGGESTYSGGLRMNSVVFYDIPYIFYGDIQEDELEDCTVYTRTADSGRIYRKIVLKDGILVGAVIAGDVRFAGVVYWAIKSRRPIPDPERYLSVSGLYSLYEEFGERDIVNLPNIK